MKILVLILLLATSPCLAQTSLTLALNWKAEPEFGGFYAAVLQGFYKSQGLDVKILEGGSGTPTIQMLANKKVDFAIVGADELIISQDRQKYNRSKALFAVYQTSPQIIMTHADRNFKSLKEVFTNEGFLSVQAGLPYFQFLTQKFGKPRVRVVPYLGGVGNFVGDKTFSQQGFITTEPLAAEKAGKKTRNFLIAEEGFNPYLVVVATTEDNLKTRPELVKKFIAATREGWIYYLKTPQSVNEHMAGLNKALDLETFNKAAEIQKPLIEVPGTSLGSMNDTRWETLVNQLKKMGLIKSTPQASDLFVK